MKINVKYKKLIIAFAILITLVAVFLIYALAGLNASAVTFDKPPMFVQKYAANIEKSDSVSSEDSQNLGKITADFSKEVALMHRVFFEDQSLDLIVPLFSHPDKAQRVKMASAFAAVNVEFTHNEESGFPDKRRQFWLDVEAHIPDIENALYEALITSAEEQTNNYIPYTLAWMPGQDQKTVELFTWAAEHHPDWWVRRFSVYFVVKFGKNEKLANMLLQSRVHDPDYRVRKEVLDLKLDRFKEFFTGSEKA